MSEGHLAGAHRSGEPPVPGPAPDLARVVGRHIDALLRRRHAEPQQRGRSDGLADRVTTCPGSMLFGGWTLWSSTLLPVPRFDPTFVVLATVASVAAIFWSTFVLISQHRMQQLADERAELELQVGLLTEPEVTKPVSLLSAVAGHLGLPEATGAELLELARDVARDRGLVAFATTQAGLG